MVSVYSSYPVPHLILPKKFKSKFLNLGDFIYKITDPLVFVYSKIRYLRILWCSCLSTLIIISF